MVLKNTGNIHDDLNRLANNLEIKLTALESMFKDRHQYSSTASVSHLQDCVTTASTVVTSASTVLLDHSHSIHDDEEDVSSEFAWFQRDYDTHSSLTLDWVTSQNADQFIERSSDSSSQQIAPGNVNAQPSVRLSASVEGSNSHTPENIEETMETQQISPEDSTVISSKPTRPPISSSRRSFSISRLFTSRPKSEVKHSDATGKTSPLQLNDLEIQNGKVVMKIVFVGDGACGKTTFMM